MLRPPMSQLQSQHIQATTKEAFSNPFPNSKKNGGNRKNKKKKKKKKNYPEIAYSTHGKIQYWLF